MPYSLSLDLMVGTVFSARNNFKRPKCAKYRGTWTQTITKDVLMNAYEIVRLRRIGPCFKKRLVMCVIYVNVYSKDSKCLLRQLLEMLMNLNTIKRLKLLLVRITKILRMNLHSFLNRLIQSIGM